MVYSTWIIHKYRKNKFNTLTHSQALQPMQGLGRLKKPPPIISISGPGPPVPDSHLLSILIPGSNPRTLPGSSPFRVFLSFRGSFFEFQQPMFFTGAGCQPAAQPSTWRTTVPLLVWAITFDLSGKGDPTSSKLPPAQLLESSDHTFFIKDRGIPLQAWTGPESSRRLRLPDFQTVGT